MDILVNEKKQTVADESSLHQVRDRFKPRADVLIVNGFPAADDLPLASGDQVVLIRRGEIPAADELETLMRARHTPGVHEKLRTACVGIAGVGGLGSHAAMALARIGVGHLILVDFDVVEPSNLNRQQYFVDQIGQPKVEALAETLARVNPCVTVTPIHLRLTPDNVAEVFAQAVILVEAFDLAQQKAMLVETFRRHFPERPVVAASGLAGCHPSNTVVTRRAGRNLVLVGDGENAARPGEGLMAPRVGIAAHHQANAVVRLLLGEEPC
jgi:sulfur carrier protein ThiS adenylyltransferase